MLRNSPREPCQCFGQHERATSDIFYRRVLVGAMTVTVAAGDKQQVVGNEGHGKSQEVTHDFEPQSGGTVPERESATNTLRQFVSAVFRRLNVTNAVNPTVQKKGVPGILNLDAAVDALGLHNGQKLSLAWQTSGGWNGKHR